MVKYVTIVSMVRYVTIVCETLHMVKYVTIFHNDFIGPGFRRLGIF